MDLVIDQMRELHHVDVADGYLLLERVSGQSVVQDSLAGCRQPGVCEQLLDFTFASAVKHRRGVRNTLDDTTRVLDQLLIAHRCDSVLPLRTLKDIEIDLAYRIHLRPVCNQLTDR